MSKLYKNLRLACVLVLFFAVSAHAEPTKKRKGPTGDGYRKEAIVDARYGTEAREKLLAKAYTLSQDLNQVVFGQEAATAVLQAKMVQYLEGYPNRSGEPVMMNMIGLPGIGKSAMIELLKNAGFPLLEFDAQNYINSATRNSVTLEESLSSAINAQQYRKPGEPIIVVVEELDKLVEKNAVTGTETTSSAIGTLNTISSEGKIHGSMGRATPVSNIMFLTTMNLAPVEIESFSQEVLGREKSYYDFTIEDFEKFDSWIRNQSSARYKVLARMFRSNTVSRFAANTMIMQPLGTDTYRRIIELQVNRAIRQNGGDLNAAKRITVDVHTSVMDFLLQRAVFAPSGARETVSLSNSLIEQLIIYGTKATGPGLTTSDRPRHIEARYHPELDKVFVRVTERVLQKGSATKVRDGNAIAFGLDYDSGSRMFLPPTNIASTKPAALQKNSSEETVRPVTKKETFESRFPKSQERTKGLKEYIGQHLFGQSEAINTLTTDLENYFGRQGPAKKEPSSRAFAGFPGIGKSELFLRAAEATKLPVARVNMQAYATDSAEAVKQFSKDVQYAIEKALDQNPSGQYLLLIEELDKVFEISPDGKFVNRPIMAKVKDLLNDGRFEVPSEYGKVQIDARAGFVGITMNFAVDRFGFEADPRMTSIEDVIRAWKKLKSTPASIKNVLASMFLPDTVSRLMTQLSIMKPLDKPAYQKIIDGQALKVQETRLLDAKGRNVGRIQLKTTPAYRKYLFNEAVIPSEGARNTTKSSNAMVSTDLEYALARLPRSSKFAKEPLTVTLDYSEARQMVRYKVQLTESPETPFLRLADRSIALKFPPTNLRGRISEERMKTSAHEFGHAFTGVQLGARFEHVVVIPTGTGAGGYVKPNGVGSTAADTMAAINMILGSRAFERIVLSPTPLDSSSVLRITSGPSQDIRMATLQLYNMLHLLGMNPDGGTLDRNFNMGGGRYASYEDMPSELAEKMGLILREMEDRIVRETLKENSREWYVDKIIKLARAGSMNEAEFYELIGKKLPANNHLSVAVVNDHFRSLFESALVKPTKAEREAAADRTGASKSTPKERSEMALEHFASLLKKHLSKNPVQRTCSSLFVAN